jgi:diguanylate cyclase (GGDEF)-like protein
MDNTSLNTHLSALEQWGRLRDDFINQALKCVLILAVVGLPISLSRSLASGWQVIYSLHIALTIIYLIFYRLRNRMSSAGKSVFIIIICWIVAIAALLTFGTAGNGITWFLFVHFFVAAIYSPRKSIILGASTLLAVAVIGISFTTGILKPSVDMNKYIVQESSWILAWVILAAMLLVAFYSMGVLQQSTRNLLIKVEEQQNQIAHMANHDQLTGLPLMRLARDRLEMAVQHADRYHTKVAMLFIDLEGFKVVNDRYGHEAGDHVLIEVAKRFHQTIRAEDTVARIGGDEFLIILSGLTEQQAAATVAEKIRTSILSPINYEANNVVITVSIGVALYPDDAEDFEALRRVADQTMYMVKRDGKNNFAFAVSYR